MDDDLLNAKKYPPIMFTDIYGNGSQCWDKPKSENVLGAVFKVKYIRADLVSDLIAEETEKHRKTLSDIDTGVTDYLVVRTKIAELSGVPAMAMTFDEHIERIRKKLE